MKDIKAFAKFDKYLLEREIDNQERKYNSANLWVKDLDSLLVVVMACVGFLGAELFLIMNASKGAAIIFLFITFIIGYIEFCCILARSNSKRKYEKLKEIYSERYG
jgi:hypothetical protein